MRVTALYAGLLAVIYLYLTFRVIARRRGRRIDLGDDGDPLLRRLIRGHANFAEYVPLGLILLAILELGTWSVYLLHLLGLMLLVGRIAHAWSFSVAELRLPSRSVGMVLTLTMLGVAALCALAQGIIL